MLPTSPEPLSGKINQRRESFPQEGMHGNAGLLPWEIPWEQELSQSQECPGHMHGNRDVQCYRNWLVRAVWGGLN